jgi:hypothetical protein
MLLMLLLMVTTRRRRSGWYSRFGDFSIATMDFLFLDHFDRFRH